MKRSRCFACIILMLIGFGDSAFSFSGDEELNSDAHELYRSDVRGALERFREAAVGNSQGAVDAFRMVGQIEFNLGHFDASIDAYREGLSAIDGWNSESPYVSRQRVEMLGKLAQSLSWRADEVAASAQSVVDPDERRVIVSEARAMSEQAVRLRGQLLETKDLRKLIRSESVEAYMLAQGRQLLALDRREEALATLRRFQETFPAWGRDDGQIVQLRFDIIRSRDLDDVQFVRELEAIWRDPELQEFDLLAMVGNNIVVRYMSGRRYDDVRRMNGEVLEFIGDHPEAGTIANVNIHAQQLLIRAAMLEGDGDLAGAREVYREVRSRFPASTWAAVAQERIDDLVER